jgi:ribosomal-protein-alanine N-acetyltransferase
MPPLPALNTLETDRLLLRRQTASDAAVFRQLWTERDVRVPPHRQIDPEGHPTEADLATRIREENESAGPRPGLLTVERKSTADVIGYCGLVFSGDASPDEPELAFELLRAVHNRGYATEAGRAVITWAGEAGYPRLWASVWDWNVASRRVLDKLGFRDTGRVSPATVHGRSLLTVRES